VKSFLKKNSIEYEYIDVDLCSMDDQAKIREDIERRGGRQSFPTIIVDDQFLITGFREEKIKEVLGI
jgi:glutaredoxin